jgi:hypothetical protein
MSKVIYKYTLTSSVEMPQGAQILDIQMQGVLIQIWALVDTTAPMETRRFETLGTGWTVQEGLQHIKSLQDGSYVWHVFEILGDE